MRAALSRCTGVWQHFPENTKLHRVTCHETPCQLCIFLVLVVSANVLCVNELCKLKLPFLAKLAHRVLSEHHGVCDLGPHMTGFCAFLQSSNSPTTQIKEQDEGTGFRSFCRRHSCCDHPATKAELCGASQPHHSLVLTVGP